MHPDEPEERWRNAALIKQAFNVFLTVEATEDNKTLCSKAEHDFSAGNMSISISGKKPNVEEHLSKCFLHNLHGDFLSRWKFN